ncbi:unnamed protein product [Ascophyllum nodosum]
MGFLHIVVVRGFCIFCQKRTKQPKVAIGVYGLKHTRYNRSVAIHVEQSSIIECIIMRLVGLWGREKYELPRVNEDTHAWLRSCSEASVCIFSLVSYAESRKHQRS